MLVLENIKFVVKNRLKWPNLVTLGRIFQPLLLFTVLARARQLRYDGHQQQCDQKKITKCI